jgi:altered-inheritance-of-mitochondria protein 13
VTAELQKHLEKADSKFTSFSESISNESDSPSRGSSSGPTYTEKPLLSRLTEKITGSSSEEPAQAPTESKHTGVDRNAVAKDLEDLRKKLNSRKRIMEKDDAVEKAKDAVVACLKVNDRRPLDCWQEVEKFKAEVGRLERSFVDKNAA